ncbi:MAG: 50S ribosome-binding GTPase [Cellulomonas sp.]|nr:50S ribosome-binding GTPase [Cellulomonas sp.]
MADGADDPRRMLARPLAAASLLEAVRDLRRDAERTRFPLHLPGSASAAASRARLVDQLGEHLIPRLTELSAPAVVVVAGSTGAGKSTLVNSLVGAEVSAAGVLRPTTRQAVLVHHPDDAELLGHHPVMEAVVVVAHEAVPRGIALLDAPDLDSVVEENREWAHRLLESADLWLFVTTATRYGDALPWQVLGAAAERGTTVAMVLNRVPAASLPKVRRDLLERMRERGLVDAPLFAVPDAGPHSGLLAPGAVAPITRWMSTLAGPDRARTVVARTLHGALEALRGWVDELAEAVQDQADAAQEIDVAITAALTPVRVAAVDQVRAGRVADGGVRARWLELTARGGALARPVSGRGAVRGSARDGRSRAAAVRPLLEDLEAGVTLTLLVAGERAREAVLRALSSADAPRGAGALLAVAPTQVGESLRAGAAAQSAADWTSGGLRLARALLEGVGDDRLPALLDDRRRAALARSVGVETVAAVALAGASGVVAAERLAGALLGAAGAGLVVRLRDDLADRVGAQIDAESGVADPVLADPDLAADAASRLRLRLAVLKELT